ncbi:MAG: tetratricopeptide repeat protein, partial [Bacteroidales bacterium]|nr:tetratricopeptide repeat protein [Bacteroidales bacterium]
MSTKNEKHQESGLDNIEGALTRTEQYIEENRNFLLIIVAAVIIVVGGFMGIRKFILEPKEKEAQSEMYMAERYFEQDSFRLALDGDVQYPGFEQIIDDYKFTKAAKVSHYYAGVSYLRLGEYEDAITHLKKFKSKD